MREESEARSWVERTFDVPRETMERLEQFGALLREESKRQNLVSAASLDHFWLRHVADSAQLLPFAPSREASWIDLGTGAGFPGLIVAALHDGPVSLVEDRRLRVEFLRVAAECLNVEPEFIAGRAERIKDRDFEVISARAFAPLARLLELGSGFSTTKTVWILPKGRNAQSELESVESSWQGEFRLEQSVTDAEARIIVADHVRRGRGIKRNKP
jgi:16S rRNA (guanine527-N7)-methyltransferase